MLGKYLRRRHRIRRNLAKAERLRLLADFSRNRSKTNQAEGEIGERGNGKERANPPATVLDLVVVVRDSTRQAQNHRDRVVGHFFLTIVGDVGHHAPEFLGTLDVNVVDANAITNYALNVRKRLQNAAGNGGPLHKEHVGATALLNDLVFSLAIRFDFFEGEARSLYNF